MSSHLVRLVTLVVLVFAAASASGQYPSKPIRLVVNFPAGTASDTVARILAASIAPSIGQPVIVENRAGADGAIAAVEVAKAQPDGYTVLYGTSGPMATVPALRKSVPYDPIRDFSPISLIGRYSTFLYASAKTPFKSLRDLIDYARANPGKLNYATGNTGGLVSMAQVIALAGNLNMVHVPYRGEPAAVVDLISNRVQVMWATPTTTMAYVKEGKLRMLATSLPQRHPRAPEVPTMAEAGMPTFSIVVWAGMFGPAKMPSGIVEQLSREVNLAVNRPEVTEQFERQQFIGSGSTPKELADFTKEQLGVYSRTLRNAGVEPQ